MSLTAFVLLKAVNRKEIISCKEKFIGTWTIKIDWDKDS